MVPISDLVVLLPGITGSVLEKDGREVWAISPQAVFEGIRTLGRSIKGLALTGDDPEAEDLGDGIRATRLMPDLHLLPGLGWKIDGYGSISTFLARRFRLTENENFLAFPYDWRRDNRANARRLQRICGERLAAWRAKGQPDAKLVFVAHSMGGLIARYYIEVLGGWKDTRALITIGTPFYGSLNAVDFLANGIKKGIGPFKVDLSPLIRSFTAIHQLVPVYKCVDVGNGTTQTPSTAGIAGWEDPWRTNLDDFFNEMEQAAKVNREDPGWEAARVRFVPIVGTDQPTNQSAVLDGAKRVEVRRDLGGLDRGGDGTVPRVSAALSGTEDVRTFAAERHASLQNYGSVQTQIAGVLESFDEIPIANLRSGLLSWFAFEVGDVYASDDPVSFGISLVTELPEWQLPELACAVTVTNRDTMTVAARKEETIRREPATITVGSLPPGAYSVQVTPPTGTDSGSVQDFFVVVDAEDPGPEDV